jgi:hypothetical protein
MTVQNIDKSTNLEKFSGQSQFFDTIQGFVAYLVPTDYPSYDLCCKTINNLSIADLQKFI